MSLDRLAQLRELPLVQALLNLHEGHPLLVADMIVQQLAELFRQLSARAPCPGGLRHLHRQLSDLGVFLADAGDHFDQGRDRREQHLFLVGEVTRQLVAEVAQVAQGGRAQAIDVTVLGRATQLQGVDEYIVVVA